MLKSCDISQTKRPRLTSTRFIHLSQYTLLVLIQRPVVIPEKSCPNHILYAQLRHEYACRRLLLRQARFLNSLSCWFPVTFLLLLTSCLSTSVMQFEVRSIFFFFRDPVGNISGSQVRVVIHYVNQPDNVSFPPCFHIQVTTAGPWRAFYGFTRENPSYYHRELPI